MTEENYNLNCAFCGNLNTFSKEELYETQAEGKELFLEKFCLHCGEPLTLICPQCNRGFPLGPTFKKMRDFKVFESYWNPTPSLLDTAIPKIQKEITAYLNIAKALTPDTFRQSQKEFLQKIPDIEKLLKTLEVTFKEIQTHKSISIPLEKEYKKINKLISKSLEECTDITSNIESNAQVVSEKKEKQLKKGLPFLDFQNNISQFVTSAQNIRNKEIEQEQDSLKPGFEKIPNYLPVNPHFFNIKCPVCNTEIICVKNHLYTIGVNDKKLQYSKELLKFATDSSANSDTNTVKFTVSVFIEKGQKSEFTSNLILLLNEGIEEIVGRDLIRELEFDQFESEDVLFDEDDPLARVSNSQMTLTKIKGDIIIKGQNYDEFRPGTFINSFDYDVRVKNPDGYTLKPGDTVIIPLTKETDNPNKIELKLK